jgi:hypothetical protein
MPALKPAEYYQATLLPDGAIWAFNRHSQDDQKLDSFAQFGLFGSGTLWARIPIPGIRS